MRRDALDAREVEHVPQLPAHVVRRQRATFTIAEQQRFKRGIIAAGKPEPHRLGSELGECEGASGLRCLRMILPLGRFTTVRDDGAANANRRRGAHDVDIAAPDREHLTDAGRRAQHDLDDRAELPVRFRPGG